MKKSGNALLSFVIVIVGIAAVFFADIFIANTVTSKNLSAGFSGSSSKSKLIDEYGMFSDSPAMEKELNDRIKQCSEEIQMNIAIYIAGKPHKGYSLARIQNFNDRFYDDTFGEYTDGLVYYMDFSGNSPAHDDISKSGLAILVYKDEVCQRIFTTLDNYLPPSGQTPDPMDISDGIKVFCERLEHFRKEYKSSNLDYYHDTISTPSVYVFTKGGKTYVTTSHPPGFKFKRLLIAEFIGLVVGLVMFLVTKSRYKFKTSANPSVYVSHEKTVFTEKSDVLIRSYVTKHKLSSSSGGGGGGGHGGGGGGGGGSHSHSSHSR